MNRTRLMDFFIVEGDCLRRLVRVYSSVRYMNCDKDFFYLKLMILIKSLLRSLMMFVALGRHFDIYIPRLSVRGLHLFTMVSKYLPPNFRWSMLSANTPDPENILSPNS